MIEKVKKYGDFVKKEINKVNNRFSTLTFLTIDEIIKDEIDLLSIWWELSEINDTVWAQHKIIQTDLENLSEEDYDDWGYKLENEIDDIKNELEWKVMDLQSLIDGLGKIRDLEEEEEILKRFKDIKPIDI
jgi:hypothetical protein